MQDPLIYSATSIQGIRPQNQDNFLIEKLDNQNEDVIAVLALADGMGGMAGGHIASELAIKLLKEELSISEDKSSPITTTSLHECINRIYFKINNKILDEAERNPELQGMGTTLTTVFLFSNLEFYVANVGDSRAYVVYDDEIVQLTIDHDVITDSKLKGIDTNAIINESLYANALTRSIGSDDLCEIDIFGPFFLHQGETILLSSDGFHKYINENEILSLFKSCDDFNSISDILVKKALSNGSDDNITVNCVSLIGTTSENKKPFLRFWETKTRNSIIFLLILTIYTAYNFYREYTSFFNSSNNELSITDSVYSKTNKDTLNKLEILKTNLISADSLQVLSEKNNHIYTTKFQLENVLFPRIDINIQSNRLLIFDSDSLVHNVGILVVTKNQQDSIFISTTKNFISSRSEIKNVTENRHEQNDTCQSIQTSIKCWINEKISSLNIVFVEDECNVEVDESIVVICSKLIFKELSNLITKHPDIAIKIENGN